MKYSWQSLIRPVSDVLVGMLSLKLQQPVDDVGCVLQQVLLELVCLQQSSTNLLLGIEINENWKSTENKTQTTSIPLLLA